MSQNELREQMEELSERQSEAMHTQALLAEAVPRVRSLLHTLMELDRQAQEGDGDLTQVHSELQSAKGSLDDLQKKAEYLR